MYLHFTKLWAFPLQNATFPYLLPKYSQPLTSIIIYSLLNYLLTYLSPHTL
ncbi:hypothetical protein KSS87_018160 [Heliosperma pusillum]|nr:hypothetical protein KSS87_018160 [Heliosperma pusillum]